MYVRCGLHKIFLTYWLWHKSWGMHSWMWNSNILGCLLDKRKSHVLVYAGRCPVPFPARESPVNNTPGPHGREAGLPYWVWKYWACRARVRLYLVRKLEVWRINRAEMFLVKERKEDGGDNQTMSQEKEREKRKDYWKGWVVSGCTATAHINHWPNERDSREMMSVLAIWLGVWGMQYSIYERNIWRVKMTRGGSYVTEAGWFPSPGPLEWA